MTSDTAMIASYMILAHGKTLDQLEFIDKPEFKLRKRESVVMPFRYLAIDGQVCLPDGMLKLWRKHDF